MADEKMCPQCCAKKGKKFMFFGVLAIVYGVIIYMMDVMGWQPYMAWVMGGIILLLIAWAKGSMKS
jgi:hypothetical protein